MVTPNARRARLSIEIEPELRQRIKLAAQARHLSVRQYVEFIMRRALQAEEAEEFHMTPAEQERTLQALAELERLDQDLQRRRGGRQFSPSDELLNEARDQRTRELMQEA